jgi:protoporphyrinogen oxidase
MFGYVPGGYARVVETFASLLMTRGVTVRAGVPVETIEADADGGLRVTVVDGGVDAVVEHFDQVVVTSNPSIADRICVGLTDDERDRLRGVRYQGIVCASVVLRRPLSPYYLTYLFDDVPFTAVVEMTAFIDPDEVGGHTLVYLPKYVAPEDPLFDVSDADLREQFLGALINIYPGVSEADVLGFEVSRVRRVFPIPTLGYSTRLPRMTASVPGLHFVSSAQIVNGTLNVNETVQLAEQAARLLARAPRPAPRAEASA